jgi:hypothetical protein
MIRALFIDEAAKSLETNPRQQMKLLKDAGNRLAKALGTIKTEGPLPQGAIREFAVVGSLAVAALSGMLRSRQDKSAVEIAADKVNDQIVRQRVTEGANSNLTPVSRVLVSGMHIIDAINRCDSIDSNKVQNALLDIATFAGIVLNDHRDVLEQIVTRTRHPVYSPLHGQRDAYALKPEMPDTSQRTMAMAIPAVVKYALRPVISN